jgi:hypothetical protein
MLPTKLGTLTGWFTTLKMDIVGVKALKYGGQQDLPCTGFVGA